MSLSFSPPPSWYEPSETFRSRYYDRPCAVCGETLTLDADEQDAEGNDRIIDADHADGCPWADDEPTPYCSRCDAECSGHAF